jgi:hypothetical protein
LEVQVSIKLRNLSEFPEARIASRESDAAGQTLRLLVPGMICGI